MKGFYRGDGGQLETVMPGSRTERWTARPRVRLKQPKEAGAKLRSDFEQRAERLRFPQRGLANFAAQIQQAKRRAAVGCVAGCSSG